jgi:hypothetical protein
LWHYSSLSLYPERKNFLDVLQVDGRIILKLFYRNGLYGCELYLAGSGQGQVKAVNETPGSVKFRGIS